MYGSVYLPPLHPWMADEGFPVSGDALAHERDRHPTQPFRWGDLLWPLVMSPDDER